MDSDEDDEDETADRPPEVNEDLDQSEEEYDSDEEYNIDAALDWLKDGRKTK